MFACARRAARPWGQWCLLCVVCLSVVCLSVPAEAHPNALSRVDVYLAGGHARVELDLDGTSSADLVQRQLELQEAPELDALLEYQPLLLGYVDQHFRLSADGASCARQPSASQRFSRATNRVYLRANYQCSGTAKRVVLRSHLFSDEATPHRIMGGVHRDGRFQRSLLDAGQPVAFDLSSLPRAETRSQTFRMALPPASTVGAPRLGSTRPVSVAQPASAVPPSDSATAAVDARGLGFWGFVLDGWRHILGGYDHLLFVCALVLGSASLKRLAQWITVFTIAHSVSLALSALELVSVSPRVVEPLIALSIVWVGVETLYGAQHRSGLALVFAFGMLHGLGFGGALRDLGLSGHDIAIPLLGFNVGVELGQLAVVVPCFALLCWQRKRRASWSTPLRTWAAAGLSLVAAAWFVERAFA